MTDMNKQVLYIITIAISTSMLFSCYNGKLYKTQIEYEKMNYLKAANGYESLNKTKDNSKLYTRIAECYRRSNLLEKSANWYKKALDAGTIQTDDYYYYAQVLKSLRQYDESKKMYDLYLEKNPSDESARIQRNSIDKEEHYKADADLWEVSRFCPSDKYSNFSPTLYDKGLVFCSDRNTKGLISEWNGKPYLNLYYAPFDENQTACQPYSFGSNLDGKYHDGPAAFTEDFKTIYFTRSMLNKKGKLLSNDKEENILAIFQATRTSDNWSDITMLPFCNENSSFMHPAISSDQRILYFASDMPGGSGGFDLYMVRFENGEWGVPMNMGDQINTRENEVFPTLFKSSDNREWLYFSTSGRAGLGGLDVYCVEVTDGKVKGDIKHLPYPINTESDDLGLLWTKENVSGYVSSSRDNNEGNDNIYFFKKHLPKFYIDVTVLNKNTKEPLQDASLSIVQKPNSRNYNAMTDSKGKYFTEVDSNALFELEAKKDMFFKGSSTVTTKGLRKTDTIAVTLLLEPIVINKAIRLDDIYYDYDKWDIRVDAAVELDKLVAIMKENPEINIELSSHTDSRGNDKYNMTLSQKRAESAVNYIISKGIDASRIYAKGYGESKLLNHCKNNVKCSEEEHQMNRRTEFKVVKITQ